jgi:hypothetical protein
MVREGVRGSPPLLFTREDRGHCRIIIKLFVLSIGLQSNFFTLTVTIAPHDASREKGAAPKSQYERVSKR